VAAKDKPSAVAASKLLVESSHQFDEKYDAQDPLLEYDRNLRESQQKHQQEQQQVQHEFDLQQQQQQERLHKQHLLQEKKMSDSFLLQGLHSGSLDPDDVSHVNADVFDPILNQSNDEVSKSIQQPTMRIVRNLRHNDTEIESDSG
jgi:hypothetical protein